MSTREFRLDIGADLIQSMETNKELPVTNKGKLLFGMMQRYRKDKDIEKSLIELGYTWRPSTRYFSGRLKEIVSILARRGKQFGHVKEWSIEKGKGTWNHSWKFWSKEEAVIALKQEHNDVASRTENHNQALDDVDQKWKTNLPHIAEVPLLTQN